jgi:hypothetical protein
MVSVLHIGHPDEVEGSREVTLGFRHGIPRLTLGMTSYEGFLE